MPTTRGFPAPTVELALHERLLANDPVASVDAFQLLIGPLIRVLQHDLPCTMDEAHDSGVDAILGYLGKPAGYDPKKGRLSSFLVGIAKKRVIDRVRARTAAEKRDQLYASTVELYRSSPKERMEAEIEAKILWQRVEEKLPSERDRRVLKLILAGERSTAELAVALNITELSPPEQRREVKQHRDRLMKILNRLRASLGHDDT